jgi:hypothetical protein
MPDDLPAPRVPANRHRRGSGGAGSPLVEELYRYWEKRRQNRLMPRKSDIDPSDLKPLLPFLLLADFSAEPFRLRYRLVGTEVVAIYGLDFTGRWLHELDFGDQVPGGWAAQYRRVFDTRRPLFGAARLVSVSGVEMNYAYGLFPLSDDGVVPTHCMDINDYRPHLQQSNESWGQLQILQRAGR